MKFTAQQISNIKLEASNQWEDNEHEGNLNDWIIDNACSTALNICLDKHFPDNKDFQGSTPYVDQWFLSKDGKRVEITNVLHGHAFTEHDVNAMASEASEIVTEALEKLLSIG